MNYSEMLQMTGEIASRMSLLLDECRENDTTGERFEIIDRHKFDTEMPNTIAEITSHFYSNNQERISGGIY